MNYKKLKKIKYLILLIIIIIPLLTFIIFLCSDSNINNNKKLFKKIIKGSDISLNKIHHIATKDGKKEWSFKSNTLTFNTTKKKAEIKDLYLTFFLKNGVEANLTSDNGIFYYESNNIEAFGNVIITDGNYILKTEHLFYNDKKKVIFSEKKVKIFGKYFDINANSININIDKGKVELNGDINAIF